MRYATFSAGGGSYRAAKIDRKNHPNEPFRLLFADTLYEDADAYRFLIEGAADILGVRLNWTVRAEDFPDYRVSDDRPVEQYCGNPEWRAFLADLRERATSALPGLIWLVEGRDPWEVFRDERFLGNSQADPCSKILKRNMLDHWRVANCDPGRDVFSVGIGEHEAHRFLGGKGKGKGLQRRMAEEGWTYHAPLLGQPELNPAIWMKAAGIAEPRLYSMDYMHNNCGGMCVKAGHAHWQNRFRVHPERFTYDQMMERKVRQYLGNPAATILTDRRGDNIKKPMTLDTFAARLRASPEMQYDYEPGSSGCGCAVAA